MAVLIWGGAVISVIKSSDPETPDHSNPAVNALYRAMVASILLRLVLDMFIEAKLSSMCSCRPASAAAPAQAPRHEQPSGRCAGCDEKWASAACTVLYLFMIISDPDAAYVAWFGGVRRADAHDQSVI
jgi:hypothetical protein